MTILQLGNQQMGIEVVLITDVTVGTPQSELPFKQTKDGIVLKVGDIGIGKLIQTMFADLLFVRVHMLVTYGAKARAYQIKEIAKPSS